MSTIARPIIDSNTYVYDRQTVRFLVELESTPGTALSLTGKTVTATIRACDAERNILDSTYEDMSVTTGPSDGETAANGGTGLTVSLDPTYFRTPRQYGRWKDYFIQYYISPDDTYSHHVVFHVLRAAD